MAEDISEKLVEVIGDRKLKAESAEDTQEAKATGQDQCWNRLEAVQ